MNKPVVIYKSKYGTTKHYAEWIAKELSCDLFELKEIKISKLRDYDTIIYGGGLYAGGMSGLNVLIKNFETISDKHLVLFTCGLANPADKENTDHIKKNLAKVLPPDMQEKIKVFHLRGGIDYPNLNVVHKCMMGMLHKIMLKKDYESLRKEDQEMLDTYGKKVDFVEEHTIVPIVEYIQHL